MTPYLKISLVAAALLAIASCGQALAPANSAAKPDQSAAQATASGALTSATLVGRWGDNGDCTRDIRFAADGTFASYTGGVGRWSLSGDRITMSGAGGTFELQIELLDQNTLLIRNPDGSFGTSQRCP